MAVEKLRSRADEEPPHTSRIVVLSPIEERLLRTVHDQQLIILALAECLDAQKAGATEVRQEDPLTDILMQRREAKCEDEGRKWNPWGTLAPQSGEELLNHAPKKTSDSTSGP